MRIKKNINKIFWNVHWTFISKDLGLLIDVISRLLSAIATTAVPENSSNLVARGGVCPSPYRCYNKKFGPQFVRVEWPSRYRNPTLRDGNSSSFCGWSNTIRPWLAMIVVSSHQATHPPLKTSLSKLSLTITHWEIFYLNLYTDQGPKTRHTIWETCVFVKKRS